MTTTTATPIVGQRYRWPFFNEEFDVLEVMERTAISDGAQRIDVSIRTSEVAWLPWCAGRSFEAISTETKATP